MSGSGRPRRTDTTGKRALFETPVMVAPDRMTSGAQNEGKAALFSSTPRRPGTVLVECSTCKARSRVSLVELVGRFAAGSAWFPRRRHSHWLLCPSCGTRRWCRVGWTE